MNKKQKLLLSALALVSVTGISSINSQEVEASSKVTVKSTKNITAKQLTKKNDKGRVFDKLPATGAGAKVKHQMKNYKDSTWIATKEAKMSNGDTYYYVTSLGGGNYGWVWSGYMKNSPKYYIKSTTNISGIYGSNNKGGALWDMPYGTKVKAKEVASYTNNTVKGKFYNASKKMTLSSGVNYYYLESQDGKTKGWVWGGYIKKATQHTVEKTEYATKVFNSNGRKGDGRRDSLFFIA